MKFRLVARVFFERETERKKLPPELNNCPTECPNSPRYYDAKRFKFCEGCPHRLERENFKAECGQAVSDTLGQVKFDFEKTVSVFYQMRNLEEVAADKISVRTAAHLSVYRSEKNRAEAIKEAERKANQPK